MHDLIHKQSIIVHNTHNTVIYQACMHAGLLKGRLWLAIPIDLETLIIHNYYIKCPSMNTLPFMMSHNLCYTTGVITLIQNNCSNISHSGCATSCNPFMQMSGYKGCLELCTSLSLPVSFWLTLSNIRNHCSFKVDLIY